MPPPADQARRRHPARRLQVPLGAARGGDARGGDRGRLATEPVATARRECLPPPATAGAPAGCQAPRPDGGGSGTPGAARRPRPRMATGAAARPTRDAAALAPRRVPRALATQVTPGAGPPAARSGDHRPDPTAGGRQPPLGRGADPWRVGQARHPRGQAHHPDLLADLPCLTPTRAILGDVPAQPRPRDLGLRLPAGDGPPLPSPVRVLHRRAGHASGRACRRHAPPDRRLGRPAAAGGYLCWPRSPSGTTRLLRTRGEGRPG